MALRHWPAAVLAMLLVAAACGDSGDETTTTVASATSATVVTSTTAAPTVTTAPATTTTTTTTLPPITVTTLPGVPGVDVSTVGIGPIRVGMTVEEVEEVSELDLVGELDPDISENCYIVAVEGSDDYEGVFLLVLDDEIGRVEIVPPSAVTTRSGAGIGMPESDVRELFPGRIEDADEYVVDGHAIAYVPADEVDAEYRVVFVIEDGVVASYRAGILPAVGFGEGCA